MRRRKKGEKESREIIIPKNLRLISHENYDKNIGFFLQMQYPNWRRFNINFI
jgi:hypothetical protein